MTITSYEDVELGDDLPTEHPDVSMARVRQFCTAAKHHFERFVDHEAAREQGFPGALVPGIMSQGLLAAMIHRWAPGRTIQKIDTVFRAPMIADEPLDVTAVVTDIDDESRQVELDLQIKNAAQETRLFGTALVRFP